MLGYPQTTHLSFWLLLVLLHLQRLEFGGHVRRVRTILLTIKVTGISRKTKIYCISSENLIFIEAKKGVKVNRNKLSEVKETEIELALFSAGEEISVSN